jgi:hypothetical protein
VPVLNNAQFHSPQAAMLEGFSFSVPKNLGCTHRGQKMSEEVFCGVCGESYSLARAAIGKTTCLQCGEKAAVSERKNWCVAPMHKSNYQLISNPKELIGLNNKGGLVK